ncbi:MAG: protein kinase [Polyangiaceae bacterium]|nr:protein kinase [Polyangiaceae bacterium]
MGTRVGKFRLERSIGSGGNGFVWAARNETTGAEVAGKVLVAAAGSLAARRFRQEARIGAWLTHRNIVRVFDLVDDISGGMMLVMERLRGETLNRVLDAQERLSPRSAVAVVMGVLAALTHAHEQGFVHRDVKPSNVLLSIEPDGVMIPKLLDFGIAKPIAKEPSDEAGTLVGTPEYMSPEQIKGKDVDGRSDVFAAGTLLYEALTGRCPFASDTLSGALAAILYRPLKRPPEIAPNLWTVLERALARNPGDRYPTARAFSLALQDAMDASAEELAASLQRIPVAVPTAALPPRFVSTPPGAFPPPGLPALHRATASDTFTKSANDDNGPQTLPSVMVKERSTEGATQGPARPLAWAIAAGALLVGMGGAVLAVHMAAGRSIDLEGERAAAPNAAPVGAPLSRSGGASLPRRFGGASLAEPEGRVARVEHTYR